MLYIEIFINVLQKKENPDWRHIYIYMVSGNGRPHGALPYVLVGAQSSCMQVIPTN